ncbi:MAG: stage V sporulation protein S [Deinococcaceae bacterium]
METLRVSGKSRPNSVAGAIAAVVRAKGRLEIQAMGPTAINQTVKALAIARDYLESDHIDLVMQPSFFKIDPTNLAEERTAMRFAVSGYRKPQPQP